VVDEDYGATLSKIEKVAVSDEDRPVYDIIIQDISILVDPFNLSPTVKVEPNNVQEHQEFAEEEPKRKKPRSSGQLDDFSAW
jgi:hypothetical protein